MVALKFAETHNLVVFLSKPEESDGFKKIIDFLNANPINYALTVNPTIYTSCIEQFWATAKAKTVNRERQLQALVDEKKIVITESTIRRDLYLEDTIHTMRAFYIASGGKRDKNEAELMRFSCLSYGDYEAIYYISYA
ncbi:hypothetical protein Tco_1256697 [Tanacetum coccineum]